jgi:hypothetical protein
MVVKFYFREIMFFRFEEVAFGFIRLCCNKFF